MNAVLSREANKVLSELYDVYKARLNNNISRSNAMYFKSSEDVQKDYLPDMNLEDLDECCRELHRNGYMNNLYAEDTVVEIQLTDNAIVLMENKLKNAIINTINIISKINPLKG